MPCAFEYVADSRVGDVIVDVGQGALDAVIAPSRVLPGELQNQVDDLLVERRPSHRLPLFAVVPLLRHELAMPAEDRVGRDDGGQLSQCFAAERLAFDGQSAALVIRQQDPFSAQQVEQGLELVILKLDDLLLVSIAPAAKNGEQQMPRLQDHVHRVFRIRAQSRSSSIGRNQTEFKRLKRDLYSGRKLGDGSEMQVG